MPAPIQPADTIHFQWYFPSKTVMSSLQKVQEGEVLSDHKRKLCVKFLCSIDLYTAEELVSIFRVPMEVIVRDLADIVDDRNSVIGSVKPVDVISEFIENQNYAIKKLKQTIEYGELKDRDKIGAIDKYSIANMRLVEVLQSLGALPKELGNMSVTSEKWIATVAADTGTPVFEKVIDAKVSQGLLGNEIINVEDTEDVRDL